MSWPTKKIEEFFRKINQSFTLRVIEIVVLIGGLYLALIQLSDLRKVNSGQIALDITRDIYSLLEDMSKSNGFFGLIEHIT